MHKTVLVVGASGLVGSATIRQFCLQSDWKVVGISRRSAIVNCDYDFYSTDLLSPESISLALKQVPEIHLVIYAALFEMTDLVAGWHSQHQMQINQQMLENLFEAFGEKISTLEQVILLQGAKAYGAHLGMLPIPAKENAPRVEHANFYWLQEDYLRKIQKVSSWNLTVFRPQIVFGDAINTAMNLVPALGVYGAILKNNGRDLDFPGGPPVLLEAIDADLLASAFVWAASCTEANNETFNISNGDVFVWENIWPTLAHSLGMNVGKKIPCLLSEFLPARENEWAKIVNRYGLLAPKMMEFVGKGFQYADVLLATLANERPAPKILSTIKIRQAGFNQCMDTEDMMAKWMRIFQQRKLLPLP
tara:strand:- start:152 stop:1237 length:1086 start_codon:yes stop_codon:yes gene_type:complete